MPITPAEARRYFCDEAQYLAAQVYVDEQIKNWAESRASVDNIGICVDKYSPGIVKRLCESYERAGWRVRTETDTLGERYIYLSPSD
jgi:hypothetical protein